MRASQWQLSASEVIGSKPIHVCGVCVCVYVCDVCVCDVCVHMTCVCVCVYAYIHTYSYIISVMHIRQWPV